MKNRRKLLATPPVPIPMPLTVSEICPLCKITVNKDDAYVGYRNGEDYKNGKYPDWAYPEGRDLNAHLQNFHRLPTEFASFFTIGFAVGKFTKEHPQFHAELLFSGATITHNTDHPKPVETKTS